jgi:hypothetical protein
VNSAIADANQIRLPIYTLLVRGTVSFLRVPR